MSRMHRPAGHPSAYESQRDARLRLKGQLKPSADAGLEYPAARRNKPQDSLYRPAECLTYPHLPTSPRHRAAIPMTTNETALSDAVEPAPSRVLTPASKRALQKAAERRRLADGDWEKGGIVSDF